MFYVYSCCIVLYLFSFLLLSPLALSSRLMRIVSFELWISCDWNLNAALAPSESSLLINVNYYVFWIVALNCSWLLNLIIFFSSGEFEIGVRHNCGRWACRFIKLDLSFILWYHCPEMKKKKYKIILIELDPYDGYQGNYSCCSAYLTNRCAF